MLRAMHYVFSAHVTSRNNYIITISSKCWLRQTKNSPDIFARLNYLCTLAAPIIALSQSTRVVRVVESVRFVMIRVDSTLSLTEQLIEY